jgi:pantothenate kinase
MGNAQPGTLAAVRLVRSLPRRPAVVAVDGPSSSGKTTLAARISAAVSGSCVVHTDDIAWRHAVLDWDGLLAEGVLRPYRSGRAVSYRPPQWDRHGRTGSIDVPASCPLLLVEGVGSGRRELSDLLDAVIWVQTDAAELHRRNAVRVAAGEISQEDHAAWMAEEEPFLAAQRTWERANLILHGSH